jgi:hypothetical protein
MPNRVLSAREAAAYCGLSLAGFRAWKARGIIPGPIKGTYKYDRKALDLAIDKASGIAIIAQSKPVSAYDKWRATRNETSIRARSSDQ